jgi:hypothetical protein
MQAQARSRGTRAKILALCILTVAGTATYCRLHTTLQPAGAEPSETVLSPKEAISYGNLPLAFEENQGQAHGQAKYWARANGYALFLAANEALISLPGPTSQAARPVKERTGRQHPPDSTSAAVVRLHWAGANLHPVIAAADPFQFRSNYFIGKNAKKWRTNVAQYARVEYRDVYPGVNLVFHGRQRQMEFDFVVAPDADSAPIALQFSGTDLIQDDGGNLILRSDAGDLVLHKPRAYQQDHGQRTSVEARFVLVDHRVRFVLGHYDRTRELIIDPTLSYSTYFGGSGQDDGLAVAVDGNGNAYVTGQTASSTLPAPSGGSTLIGPSGSFDVFVTKFDPSGKILYTTFIGGSQKESGNAIAVDSAGNAYVAGATNSADFPATSGAYQPSFGGGSDDAFALKLNPTGSALLYSTFFGGSIEDIANALAIDSSGSLYLTGQTTSTAATFPLVKPIYNTNNGTRVSFVAKIAPLGGGSSDLLFSTFLGGTNQDIGRGIALQGTSVYITGGTSSSDFPTTSGAYQTKCGTDGTCNGGSDDAFLAVLKTDGTPLLYSTFLGGSSVDRANAIAVDANGVAYIGGLTQSSDFPHLNGYQSALAPGALQNGFVTKISPAGKGASDLVYSTYLGGNGSEDEAVGITLDSSKNIYVTGRTSSTNFPLATALAGGSSLQGPTDAFVTELNGAGSALVFSTYLGGSGDEDTLNAGGLAVDSNSNIYVTGDTTSAGGTGTGFPLQSAAQTSYGGSTDAFVAKIAPPTFLLSVTLAGTGTGSVSSSPSGIQCGVICSATFANATTVTLTAAPNAGSAFAGWSGGGCSGTGICVVAINAATVVTATFDVPDFTIAASPPGAVTAGNSTTSTTVIAAEGGFTGTVTFSCSGLPAGATCTSSPTSVTGSGTSTVTINTSSSTPPGNANVTVIGSSASPMLSHGSSVTLNVLAPGADFAVAAAALSPTSVTQGGAAGSVITLTLSNGFNAPVTLSCNVTPAVSSAPTCSFNPAPVPGGSTTATLTVSTTAPVGKLLPPWMRRWTIYYAMLLPVGALALLGVGVGSPRKKLRVARLGLLVVLALALTSACSGGNRRGPVGGTPKGTYSITVTGSASVNGGAVTHNASAQTLTVN